MGIESTGVSFLQRLRPSRLFPHIDIGVEGSARLCAQDHPIVYFLEDPPRSAPVHIDVTLSLWTKSNERVAVRQLDDATVASRGLSNGDPHGIHTFTPFALDPGTRREKWPLSVVRDWRRHTCS